MRGKPFFTFRLIQWAILIIALSACMPEAPEQRISSDNSSSSSSTDTDNSTPQSTQLDEANNFFQLSSAKYLKTLPLFSDYQDSFIIRGNEINNYLKQLSNPFTKKLCMLAYFPQNNASVVKPVLVLSAKVRTFINYKIGSNEYYLQLEVANKTANAGDCLSVELNTAINNKYSTTAIAYGITDVCTNCSLSLISNGLKAFTPAGVEDTFITLSYLNINLSPALGSSSSGSYSCTSNANCSAQGLDCCLNGQCVNHGKVKTGVDTSSDDYINAVAQILARPELINNYQDIFYICPTMVPTNPEDSDDDVEDPVTQSDLLVRELKNLYQCLNPQLDEYSICTKEYTNASKLINGISYTFAAAVDDITFSSLNSSITFNNIVEIDYGGKTLFKEKLQSTDIAKALIASDGVLGSRNDSISSSQSVVLSSSLPSDALEDTVSIRYLVDGSCKQIGSLIAQCTKYYTFNQSSNPARPSDHDTSYTFRLPSYANTSYNVIVNVSGSNIAAGSSTWSLSGGNVVFNSSYNLYTNQDINITYFVTSNISDLMASKIIAQNTVNTYCACDKNYPCNLKEVIESVNGVEKVTNYSCYYTGPDQGTPPLQETVYLSSRTVPHKFFDASGVFYDISKISQTDIQEGTAFTYDSNNYFKPSNASTYVGFNEILGSFNKNDYSPMPATSVTVVKGRNYDVFVDQGVFSTCLSCGSDYYSGLQKIFPGSFLHKGGGYRPDTVESRRRDNAGSYPADDLYFGRACFVPPTMIPWAHTTNSDIVTQRRNRLSAQHFLFANGYNRDWYGFDYGSLIGSFDGVKWFSIGNQRRIKATSNKLFIAINQYFGDLTVDNSFKVTVNELSSIINSGSSITHDLDSDGAECQKSHLCDTDQDCTTQLGYDYACVSVNTLYTPWPSFDNNGNEVSGSTNLQLLSLVGGSNGKVKRCVYRGKGAPCERNFTSVTSSNSYAGSSKEKVNACSSNNYCADINTNNFNTKIARYGGSPANQNLKSYITQKTDTFGLKARIIGRPYSFYGSESAPSSVITQLDNAGVSAICIPGKDPDASSTYDGLNSATATSADALLNVGVTLSSTSSAYYNACPAVDDDGEYVHMAGSLSIAQGKLYSIAQNISSNALSHSAFTDLELFNDQSSLVTQIGHQANTCLRAPGASCFTDFECAPNKWAANKISSLTDFAGLNEAEQNFWQEGLVCATDQNRYLTNSTYFNPSYDITQHKCCRETQNTFTFDTQPTENNDFLVYDENSDTIYVPGVNMSISDDRRYSRINTIYDKLGAETSFNENTQYPPLYSSINSTSASSKVFLRQYNTLDLHNQRMCCTDNWVRSFSEEKGGGHKFLNTSLQIFNDLTTFKTINWAQNRDPADDGISSSDFNSESDFTCTSDDVETVYCEVKNLDTSSQEQLAYLNYFGKFELLGIPQVLIERNVLTPLQDDDQDNTGTSPFKETIDFTGGSLPVADYNLSSISSFPDTENLVSTNNSDQTQFISAASMDKFAVGKVQVFSSNEFNCCIPTGVALETNQGSNDCCTGQAYDNGTVKRCCLNDFVDVSVYTNRYVSSEGRNFNGTEVPDSMIDPYSGYLDKEVVLQMAKSMCCSGEAAYGQVISELIIPIGTSGLSDQRTVRWAYLEGLDDTTDVGGVIQKFKAGLRWNNHVYCVPQGFTSSSSSSSSGATSE